MKLRFVFANITLVARFTHAHNKFKKAKNQKLLQQKNDPPVRNAVNKCVNFGLLLIFFPRFSTFRSFIWRINGYFCWACDAFARNLFAVCEQALPFLPHRFSCCWFFFLINQKRFVCFLSIYATYAFHRTVLRSYLGTYFAAQGGPFVLALVYVATLCNETEKGKKSTRNHNYR